MSSHGWAKPSGPSRALQVCVMMGHGCTLQPSHGCVSSLPQLSLKCRAPEVSQYVYQAYDAILKN